MPVILSDRTYKRFLKMLEKWEKGKIIEPGKHLITEEEGTGYQKLGLDTLNTNFSGSSLIVSDGTNTVNNVSRMNFIGTLFSVTSSSAGTANIGLRTSNCN